MDRDAGVKARSSVKPAPMAPSSATELAEQADSEEIAEYVEAFKAAFSGPEHQPFLWECGEPGALLIHGFAGTPAEVRPLGRVLCEAGWSAHAPLLPGFGSDIDTLFERDSEAWLNIARRALVEMKRQHSPVLLVGYSMGASLAIQIADELQTDGLILVSPFWRLPFESLWLRLLSHVLQLFIRKVRPFKNVDFSDRDVRSGIHEVMPDLDLDDPEVRERIREMSVPTRIVSQVGRLGREAFRAAPTVTAPTLIIQGVQDEVVPPQNTRRLLTRVTELRGYHELPGAHNLVRAESPAWDTIVDLSLRFAGDLADQHNRG
ncbi:MAG: alpha/beta hydrolase [Anaerolineae bacterium]